MTADRPLPRKKKTASAGAPASCAGADRPDCEPSSSTWPLAGLACGIAAATWSMLAPVVAPPHRIGPVGATAAAPMVRRPAIAEAVAARRKGLAFETRTG